MKAEQTLQTKELGSELEKGIAAKKVLYTCICYVLRHVDYFVLITHINQLIAAKSWLLTSLLLVLSAICLLFLIFSKSLLKICY